MITLCPAQTDARDALLESARDYSLLTLWGRSGTGLTTVMRDLHAKLGGAYIHAKDYVDAHLDQNPAAIEETFYRVVMEALEQNETVFVDDLDLLCKTVGECRHFYPRAGFFDVVLTAIAGHVEASGKRLVAACGGSIPGPLRDHSFPYGIAKFKEEDYRVIVGAYLKSADQLDFAKIHRFAPKLNAYQLQGAAEFESRCDDATTESFIEYLRSQSMGSNVELAEVQAVDLRDLKGVDDVIESLEANIIVPLENSALAEELDIRPKRGVLLAGPPGTGKTTVGRALAHRLKSKFFLIDGTFISGTRDFYENVQRVFEAAKNNAPSIIFIDDSDVIFESGEEMGLYRYLLTMLDGLESESAGRVCVMLTAMDVGNLPPALIRSGRVELWLETRLPEEEARKEILAGHAAKLPKVIRSVDLDALAAATEGLTGADLRRLFEDGKLLYAYDRSRRVEASDPTEYFLRAIETVRSNREKYVEAEARARVQRPSRPSWFSAMGAMAAMDFAGSTDADD